MRLTVRRGTPIRSLALTGVGPALLLACNALLGLEEGYLEPACNGDDECLVGGGSAGEAGAGELSAAGGASGAAGANLGGETSADGTMSTGATTITSTTAAAGAGGDTAHECETNETRCDADGRLRTCNEDGQWDPSNTCPFLCQNDQCVGECTPDDKECADGVTPKVCDENAVWRILDACPAVCTAGQCAGACTPDELQCAGTDLLRCEEDGTWQIEQECAFACDTVELECTGECVSGTLQCEAKALQFCDDSGKWNTISECPHECLPDPEAADKYACSQCTRNDSQCVDAETAETCDSTGRWQRQSCGAECIGDACVDCTASDGLCPNGCVYATDADCKRPNSTDCDAPEQCESGACIDGVCCNGACTGTCNFCNLPGATGTCTNLDFSTDPENCGACGTDCSTNHVDASCSAGNCEGDCQGDWRDCNEDLRSDGCEVDTSNDVDNCGACGNDCTNLYGDTACDAGSCNPTCDADHFECDGDLTNGCECARIKLEGTLVASATSGFTGIREQYTLKNDVGAGRMLVLLVAAQGVGEAAVIPSGVSLGLPFTLVHRVSSGSDWVFVFLMRDADMLPAGTYPFEVYESTSELVANLYEFSNVDQEYIALGGTDHGDCSADAPADALSVTSEAWILSGVSLVGGTGSAVTDQVVLENQGAAYLNMLGGYLPNVPAGSHDVAWSTSGCATSAHALVALRPR